MNQSISLSRGIFITGVMATLFTGLALIMSSGIILHNSTLAFAISIDLVLTVPLIYYLLIRKTSIPITTILPVVIVGIVLGSYFLPQESQAYLSAFKTWGLPVLELIILSYVSLIVRRTIKSFKETRREMPDFFTAVTEAAKDILPSGLVRPFATEIAVFYYSFFTWEPIVLKPHEFSYHVKRGSTTTYVAFVLLITVETVVLHLLIERWNSTIAWILTGLGTYTVIQMIGLAKSLSRRPVSIGENNLTIRYGIFYESVIPVSMIQYCDAYIKTDNDKRNTTFLSPISDLESPNILIELHSEHLLKGPYGINKRFTRLAFHIDEPTHLISALKDQSETFPTT